ncbi:MULTISPECIES: M48 family metallopeptidase [unclassified Moraxella]|uniref:M48 family metallopeptidase n=1 Tax=unclassified Moraxella TaxID=2685852 RepID=UPI003AF7224B
MCDHNNILNSLLSTYANANIKLIIEPKKVKNINFRLKPLDNDAPFTTLMTVSYPVQLPKQALIQSLQNRLAWAIDFQQKQHKRQKFKPKKSTYFNDIQDLQNLTLDSDIYFEGEKITVQALFSLYFKHSTDFSTTDIPRTLVSIFKFWLVKFIEIRQLYWEHKVGKSATKITPYTMKTRWGSCSTNARTIRLSIWLAQFELRCTDYVLVHELCHLHEANHSAKFWGHVERVMPDYQVWHQRLKVNHLDDDSHQSL